MRKLSMRERVLLVCLAVVAAGSAYVLFFHMPMTQRMEALQVQVAQEEELVSQLEARLMQQQRMEQVLHQLSMQENAPRHMPEYDNQQAVMVELHDILRNCRNYSLSFREEPGEEHVLCRRVSMPFTCSNYQQVHDTLQQLHDSPLRSALSDLELTQQENGTIKVSAVMTFFEYSDQVPE